MIVEWHNHVHTPEEAADPIWQGRCPMTIENVLEQCRKCGVDLCVVSNAMHHLRGKSRAEAVALLRRWDDYAAGLQETYRGSVVSFATTIPGGGPEINRELIRALDELKLKGVFINSSWEHNYPDEDEAMPFWEIVAERDVPVMIHPPHVGYGEEKMREYRLASSIGRPADNCLALARIIVRGILERFPTLKIVGSHIGGGICDMIGRMDYAYELQDEAFFLGSYSPMLIKAPPSHYLKKMYPDLVCYALPAAKCALETMGAEHVIYGSDAPPLTSLKPRAIQLVRNLQVNEADREKIFAGNALRLLKLSPAEIRPG